MATPEKSRQNGFLSPERVHSLRRKIPQDLVRIQNIPDPKEAWGVVVLDNLPFYFRASKASPRDVSLVAAGEGVAVGEKYSVGWWSHAPYPPFDFFPPVFAGPIEDVHREFFLRALGVLQREIDKAKRTSRLDQLYKGAIEAKRDAYEVAFNNYYGDHEYAAAVTIACEEKSLGRTLAPVVKEWM